MRGKPAKAACQTCRARHHPCDRKEPVCEACRESGRRCVPNYNVRFRRKRNDSAADAGLHVNGSLAFDRDQVWLDIPRKFSFVTESQGATVDNGRDKDRGALTPPDDAVDGSYEISFRSPSNTDDGSESYPEGPVSSQNTLSAISPAGETSPSAINVNGSRSKSGPDWLPQDLVGTPGVSNSCSLYVDPVACELIDDHRIKLLKSFKDAVGVPWFDITDTDFTAEALRLAPSCPLLLFSMLATACMYQSRFETDTGVARQLAVEAEDFHENCVSLLLPMLHDHDSITDGAFLACSTILRFYEEISAPFHGRDDARHLLGGYASVAESQSQDEQQRRWDGIGRAAFWVHQRQDVFNALINQRLPMTDLSRSGIDRSTAPADDFIWAKRATCLNAEVVEFCMGPDAASAEKHVAVKNKIDEWDRCKPVTFTPVLYRERDPSRGLDFADIRFLLDIGVYALSYHCFSVILLAIFDPTLPRIGPRYLQGQRRLKETVLSNLRYLCGLTSSNDVPPARVVCCLALAQCGTWVTDEAERNAILSLLMRVDKEDAWPTYATQQLLKGQWDEES